MDEEKTGVGVLSESLEPVCGGIMFVCVEAAEGGKVGARVDGDAD